MVPVKRRRFLQTLAVASIGPWLSACAGEDRQAGEPFEEEDETQSLAQAAAASGRGFGAAVNAGTLRTRSHGYRAVLGQCSSVTPEWSLKWDRLCPRPGRYDFHEADRIADFARGQGKRMRGHTLLWHLGMPRWADALLADTREWGHVRSYFHTVMPRYADVVDEWDVVNEPIEPNHGGNGLRQNQFYKAFGEAYIERALEAAKARAPRARMVINEYGLEYNSGYEGQRRLSLLRLLERLRSRGAPVDTVGLQAHLDLRKGNVYADGIYGMMRDIRGMGLKVAITELDVAEANTGLSIERRDALVADETRRYLDIVLQFNNVLGVSTWGLSDSHSWLRTQRSASNRGLPYDREWQAKPMHSAILTAFA